MSLKIGSAYVRVSSDDQLEYSPDSQLKVIRDHAKREGYIIPDEFVYQDDGISGKSADKRPAFRLMIATAKEGKKPPFDAIFVWKYSRFARNQEEAIMYKNLLKKRGVDVRSISEPSSDSPFSTLIERIIEWMDEYYLINLAGEVRRGMAEKSTRGEAMGRPPFGYRVENKILVPDKNAITVRWIFEQYTSGRTMRDIAVELGNSGVTIKSNRPPDIYAISYILRNPAYIGKIRWTTEQHEIYRSPHYIPDQEKLPEGKHEPIISEEIWNAAQTRLKDKDTSIKYLRKNEPNIYMLKGLIRCSDCGSTLVYRKERKALQCYKYSRGQCHATHYISVQKADETVIERLEQLVKSGKITFSPKFPPENKITRDWDKLIASEEARLGRAKSALLDGVFSPEEYRQIKEEILENIKKLNFGKQSEEKQRPESKAEKVAYKKKVLDVLDVIRSPDVDPSEKNQALRSIIDKIVYDKQNNRFDFYFSI